MNGIAPSSSRRWIDVTVALIGLLLLFPVMVATGVLVRLTSAGPALFVQTRIGQGGRHFRMLKFRTMYARNRNAMDRDRQLTVPGDPRVTPLGRVLRRVSLDEVPQLINVLRGDMTLVGPRPESPALAFRYPVEARWVFQHRPGLTGPTQVLMRDTTTLLNPNGDPVAFYLSTIVPRRVAMDRRFLANPTTGLTVSWLWRTAKYILTGSAADPVRAGNGNLPQVVDVIDLTDVVLDLVPRTAAGGEYPSAIQEATRG